MLLLITATGLNVILNSYALRVVCSLANLDCRSREATARQCCKYYQRRSAVAVAAAAARSVHRTFMSAQWRYSGPTTLPAPAAVEQNNHYTTTLCFCF